MKFIPCAIACAAAALLAGAAHADISRPSTGDGTVLFVAIDADANIAFTADLGLRLSSFANSESFTTGLAAPVTWNFATNATNAGGAGTNAWSTAYDTFKSTQTGANFTWGVIAGNSVRNGVVPLRSTLATGNPSVTNMLQITTAATVTNQLTPLEQWMAGVNNFGNLAAANTNGAGTNTPAAGGSYQNGFGGIQNNFNGTLTWSYMLANGASSPFHRIVQLANPTVTQFGLVNAVDSLAADPITFTFDINTNTLVLAPVPEPGTYAMLLAGLAAVGFMVRRRRAN